MVMAINRKTQISHQAGKSKPQANNDNRLQQLVKQMLEQPRWQPTDQSTPQHACQEMTTTAKRNSQKDHIVSAATCIYVYTYIVCTNIYTFRPVTILQST